MSQEDVYKEVPEHLYSYVPYGADVYYIKNDGTEVKGGYVIGNYSTEDSGHFIIRNRTNVDQKFIATYSSIDTLYKRDTYVDLVLRMRSQ